MPESFNTPEESATSSNGVLHGAEANASGFKNRKNLTHAHTERFKRAYSQIDKDRAMQLDNDKLTFSGVVFLATEDRQRRPMLEVAFRGLTLSIGKKKLLQCVTGKLSPG